MHIILHRCKNTNCALYEDVKQYKIRTKQYKVIIAKMCMLEEGMLSILGESITLFTFLDFII